MLERSLSSRGHCHDQCHGEEDKNNQNCGLEANQFVRVPMDFFSDRKGTYHCTIDYCSLIGRKNFDVNKVIAQEDRPIASALFLSNYDWISERNGKIDKKTTSKTTFNNFFIVNLILSFLCII